MLTTYADWAAKYPDAARELGVVLTIAAGEVTSQAEAAGEQEAGVQARVRLGVARLGAFAWRNNVGATPAKCPKCGLASRPVRYGLANDSEKMNKSVKSSDLILGIPRLITPDMVGRTVLQFGSLECKRPGWVFGASARDLPREAAQLAWIDLINKMGGFAAFTTGDVSL